MLGKLIQIRKRCLKIMHVFCIMQIIHRTAGMFLRFEINRKLLCPVPLVAGQSVDGYNR